MATIEILPGSLDDFTGTKEELDQLVESITLAVNNDTLFDSPPDDLDEEELAIIADAVNYIPNNIG